MLIPPEKTDHPDWVHHDLPHRLEHLGLPVCVIPPDRDVPDDLREGLPSGWTYPPIEAF